MSVIIKRTRTETFEITAIGLDTFTYDAEFRRIRSQHRKQYIVCFNCHHNFKDGDKTSLAQIKNKVNELLCHDCAVKLQGELYKGNYEHT